MRSKTTNDIQLENRKNYLKYRAPQTQENQENEAILKHKKDMKDPEKQKKIPYSFTRDSKLEKNEEAIKQSKVAADMMDNIFFEKCN